ncbi:MAG: efflux RND transporter permease subunit [Bacteroidales bacterium]|nr:efflux RND transporter permease subunit [Bacteroidales bacterium]
MVFNALLKHYTNMVRWLLGHKWLTLGSVAIMLLLFGILFKVVPTGFIPNEDMGTLFVDLTPPPGYTASKTFDLMNRNCDKISELSEVQDVGGVVGVGADANIFIQLKPWKERRGKSHSSSAIMEKIDAILSHETEAQSFV